MKNILYLCTIIIIFNVNFSYAQHKKNLEFKHYTIDDNLTGNTITSIFQDYEGIMWFGTYKGFNKFDGLHFTKYTNNPDDSLSLSSSFITSLCEDSKGNLWIGTDNGINKLNRNLNNFIRYNINKNESTGADVNVIHILADKSDAIWIASNHSGLYRLTEPYNNDKGYRIEKFTHNPDDTTSISTNSTRFLAEAKNGDIWIGGRDKKIDLNRFNKKKGIFVHYKDHAATNKSNTIFSVHVDNNDNLLVGTWGSGLNYLNKKTNIFSHYTNNPENPSSLSHNIVLSILEDSPSVYWVGTRGGGLNQFFLKTERFVHYQNDIYNPSSLNDNFILSIYKDRSGVLWVGTTNGGINATNLNSKKFRYYKKQPNNDNSINNNNISSFIETTKGLIWISTKGGGISLFDKKNNTFTNFVNDPNNSNSLNDNNINVLYEDKSGKLWIGTDGNGICNMDLQNITYNKINNPQFTCFQRNLEDSTCLSNNTICAICEDKYGFLWIGTYGGGISKYNPQNKTFSNFIIDKENPNIIENNSIITIIKDKNDDIWFGSRVVGLMKFTPVADPRKLPELTHFRNNSNDTSSISSDKINSIYESKDGTLWIGTDKGFSKVIIETSKNSNNNNIRFENYSSKNGMNYNFVNGIVEDNNNNIWLSTGKDLCKFNPTLKKFTNYSKADGIQNTTFAINACMVDKEGDIYFGGSNGIDIFNPDSIYNNMIIPNIIISDFKIFNKSVKVGEEINGNVILKKVITETKSIILSYKESVLSFEFAALHYANPQENKYAYFMEGFDHKASGWTYVNAKRNVATYTNLNPGEYTFKVKGSNSDGIWNETGTSLKITITPPYWETWWFRSLIISLIIVLSIGFYLWKVNQLQKQKHILEQKVRKRTEQLQESNTILEENREEINQQNEELEVQKSKLEAKNSKLNQQKEELLTKNNEIIEQKSEIEKSYSNSQLLSEFGQKITSKLDMDEINNMIYKYISTMMDINAFGIGLKHQTKNIIEYHNFIENNKSINYFFKDVNATDCLISWCFKNQKEIFINNLETEYRNYISDLPNILTDKKPLSVIHIPLSVEDKKIGTITVSSNKAYNYNKADLTNLKTLVSYIAIALDNANAYRYIDLQNENIKGSIRYAQTIQQSILPSKLQMDAIFNNFILYLPKDIVSGDFYWFTSIKMDDSTSLHFTAVVDCTGHGVPGAFMSLIGNRLLNEITNQKKVYEPCDILRLMNLGIRKALRQDETDNDDGMDVCLIRVKSKKLKITNKDAKINRSNNKITEVVFSGAKRPLYYYNSETKKLKVIKGNINTIGGKYFKTNMPFINHIIRPNKGDAFYLSSDGFIDQHNNNRNRFSGSKFKNMIIEVVSLPMEEQCTAFEHKLNEHKQNEKQRDDIAVIGIKI